MVDLSWEGLFTEADKAYLSRIRRQIHEHPELGYQEFKTSRLIADELRSFGLTPKTQIAETGVVAVLEGANPGPVIGFRADMDALPIEEKTQVSFASKHTNQMHACGHDTHVAMLLTAARILTRHRDQLSGSIKFIFQPAEEMLGGAKKMIEEGCLNDPPVQAIYGFHVWPDLPSGKIGLRKNALMASIDAFSIQLIGQSGHGAMPQQGRDALVGAAHLIIALQTITSREISPLDSCVVAIGKLNSGNESNVIAAKSVLEGNIRTLNPQTRARAKDALERITKGIAETFRLQANIHYSSAFPVTVNHEDHIDFVQGVIAETLGAEAPEYLEYPSMASEDFSFFLEQVPGCYMFLGVNDGAGGRYKLHTPEFLPNERDLELGVQIYLGIAKNILSVPIKK
ncbi:M20 metallopeptidase family protein [Basilea psittacipulmonis]|uniref:Peptidase M20 dimerisation domain-containing protein n=1 Tax=Basilea psittacipulmonis DSM 24701 TaxID=1072685 RepID=A0A077DJN7_9BURK|nr:M20 family metallopeptidase [Basilea psittacipulmonis]AIL33283.1 hypothetical protein IX83_08220 [Basilea psittacipulmonis DSM 24701]